MISMAHRSDIVNSIPLSGTDTHIRDRGYDLLEEYARIIDAAGFDPMLPVLELASGPGRAAAVLSRLGFRIISGDISLEKTEDLRKRVTPEYENMLRLCRLDIAHLPFADRSSHSVLCVNTIHELVHPHACIRELVRVHQPEGTLVVSDFNEFGFDLMQEIHLEVHGKDHFRGPVGLEDIIPEIRATYIDTMLIETPLNTTYIFRRKRS